MSHPPLEQLCSGVHMDLSENVVPLNPLLCHHFPYQIAILWDSMGISHFQTNPYKHVGANQHVQPKVRNRLYPIQYPGFLGQPCLLLEGLTGLFLCFLRCLLVGESFVRKPQMPSRVISTAAKLCS